MVTPETLRTEQIDSAFASAKIDWATRHVARMDPALASGSDVDAILFARSEVCRMLNKQSGQRISTARTGGAS